MYFCNPAIDRSGFVLHADGMDNGNPVIGKQGPDLCEIAGISLRSDMFQHADRYDLVEMTCLVPIVTQMKIDTAVQAGCGDHVTRMAKLMVGQGNAGDPCPFGAAGDGHGKPAPAAADIKDPVIWLQIQLRGEAGKLYDLCGFKRVFFAVKISASILRPWIQKAVKQGI